MQRFVRNLILAVIIAVAGCAPTPPPVPPTVPGIPGHPVFLEAEQAFDNGQYTKALNLYNTFLHDAYGDRFVDAALFKVGKIFRLTGRNEDALAVLARLKHEFPQSAFVSEATLEALKIRFDSGDYPSVVEIGLAYSQTADSKIQRTPFFAIIADAYEAMNANLDAMRYRYQALVNATGEDEQRAWDNFKKGAESLRADEIQELVMQVTDQRTMGFLLYRLGMAFIMEEKYDDAMDVLSAFVEQFPSHPDRLDASEMIASLKERSRFTPFTIGCVLPLSGTYGLFGQRAMDGIELAFSQINAAGGGIPFKIIVKDSRSDPGVSVSAVEELDQQRVGAILGPMSVSDTAAEIAQRRGIPTIVFTQKEGVTDIGPYVFRNFITPKMQVQSLVSFAVDELGVNRFAILYPNEHYGQRYMHLFWDQVVEQGRVVNGVEAYDPGSTDFATPIKKLTGIYYDIPKDLIVDSLPKPLPLGPLFETGDGDAEQRPTVALDPLEALTGIPLDREAIDALGRRNTDKDDQWHPIVDFDAIFIPDAPKKAGLIIPQLAYYDIRDVYLLGTNLWNSQTLLEMSGDYMKNTLIADGFFAQSQRVDIKAFVDAFKQIYDRVPGIIEAASYDSAMMVFQTMRQTATDSRREIKEALLQIKAFDGVSGRTRFAPNGEAQKSMQMLRIQHGRFVEAKPSPEPSPAIGSPSN